MSLMDPAPTHLPSNKEIRDLLSGLLGREVELTPTSPLGPSADSPRSVAVYVDDRVAVRAVAVCDLAFSARAGAALALIPAPVAEEAIEANFLGQTLGENLSELLNVMASVFNVPQAAHVRLQELHPAGPPLPPQIQARMLTLGRREDLEVTIAGYGQGRLSVVICA
jgi:hypothetical protein